MESLFDDNLFEGPSSQESFYDTFSDESEGEILFGDLDDELTLWDVQGSPSLTEDIIADTPYSSNDDADDDRLHAQTANAISGPEQSLLRDRLYVITRIEAVLEQLLESLVGDGRLMTITLKSRSAHSRRHVKIQEGKTALPEPKVRNISFPGASAQEAWNFSSVLLRILEIVYSCLLENTIMTKRDIYYRHPDLFRKQTVVDRYVDDLACTFGVTRSQLNVTAAAKGLVAGNFTILRAPGHRVHAINELEGMLVPTVGEGDTLTLNSVRWILVIEKESVVCLIGLVLICQAKGYPDIASRRFLRSMVDQEPCTPVFTLMDYDPDGIAIMSTYKYGSYRLAHEDMTSSDTPALSLSHIRWLGLKGHHMSRTPVGESGTDTSAMPRLQGLMKLTGRDRAKATRMLEWDLCAEHGPEQEWRQELQSMLMLNIKAEMQILDELPGGLVSWIQRELTQACEQAGDTQVQATEDGMLF
ncbi:hypothetical protein NX059_009849 [Plenodomus lindquistii]|nr:hypothetical protein NX059_009849 [Plenodomus lindquistii]